MDLKDKIIASLNEVVSYADKNDFEKVKIFTQSIDTKDSKGKSLEENLVYQCKQTHFLDKTNEFVKDLDTALPGQIEKIKDDYLNTMAIRINNRQVSYLRSEVDHLTKDNARYFIEKVKELNFADISPDRLNRFKDIFKLKNLEKLAKFYNKLKNDNFDSSLAISEIEINDELIEELDFIKPNKEGNDLEKKYLKLISYYNFMKEEKDSDIGEKLELKFHEERRRLERDNKSIDNELKELYVDTTEKDGNEAEKIKEIILYLETNNSIDDCTSYVKYKKNGFKERINFWKNELPKIKLYDDNGQVKEKIKEFCIDVVNQKIYNTARNLIDRINSNGLITQNIDLLEGVVKIIGDEMKYLASGYKNETQNRL